MNIIKGISQEAKAGQFVSIDTEFFNMQEGKLHRPHGDFASMQVHLEGSDDVYIIQDQHDIRKALSAVKKGTWVMSNAVFDIIQLRRFADIKPRYIWDTELVERCAYGGLYDTFSLKDQARRWLDVYMEKETRDSFATTNEMTPEMDTYAALDVYYDMMIAQKQRELLEGTEALKAYNMIDAPAIWPTVDMTPMKVDVDQWRKNVQEYAQIARETEGEIGVNSMSPQQVKRKAAEYGLHLKDTAALTLEEYKDNEFVAGVLKARMYRKAVSTYGESWLDRNVEEGDLVYASWRVTGAETGRRSCSNPNLQQIPARKMPEYRDLFISKYGRMMVGDAKLQELCILAYESQDKLLLESLRNKEDLHQATGDALGIDRDGGKIINYAIPYGTTYVTLAKRLGISEQEAQTLLTMYFGRYKGVFSYINSQKAIARKLGYVTTVSGRPVYVNPHNHQWENNAVNSPIQGGAGDFSKLWEILLWEGCQSEGIPYSVCGVIHDELVTDPPKEVYKLTRKLKEDAFYQSAARLFKDVPFGLDLHSGKRWSCKKLSDEEDDYDDFEEE